jgi:hypothetical protein
MSDCYRSLLQLENLISLVEQARVAINSEVLITPTLFIDEYELFHNPSQEDFELGQRGQFIASIALKIMEADPNLNMDQAWQLLRLFLENPFAQDVVDSAFQGATGVALGEELGLPPVVLSNIGDVLREDARSHALELNEMSTRDAYRDISLNLQAKLQRNKVLLVSHSQGTIYSTLLVNDPQIRIATPNPEKSQCFISTLQIANMSSANTSVVRDGVEILLYVTSANDLVVQAVRGAIETANALTVVSPFDGTVIVPPSPIGDVIPGVPILILPEPPNVQEPRVTSNDTGHGFNNTYFWGSNARALFVSQIGWAIERLVEPDSTCFELEIEQIQLPAVTRGGVEELLLKATLKDAEGTILLDENGERVPIDITLEAVRGTVTPLEGITDGDGTFRASAQISPNLPVDSQYMLVTAVARYQLPSGETLEKTAGPLRMNLEGTGSDTGGGGGGSFTGSRPPGSVGNFCFNCGTADIVGDPHIYTFDRRRYSFQGAGEYLLSRSSPTIPTWSPYYNLDDGLQPLDPFELQARLRPFAGSTVASVTSGIAIRFGDDRASLTLQPQPELNVNGQLIQLEPGGRYTTDKVCQQFDEENTGVCQDEKYCLEYEEPNFITCISSEWYEGSYGLSVNRDAQGTYIFRDAGYGASLNATPYFTESERFAHLSVNLYLPQNYTAAVEGLLGDYDNNPENDLFSTEGVLVSEEDFNDLYQVFGDSWRVNPETSLFHYRPGENPDTFKDPTFPTNFPTITSAQRESATRICSSTSIPSRLSIEDCIYDVTIMGSDILTSYGGERLPIEDASQDYAFNPMTNFVFPRIQEIDRIGEDYIVLTASPSYLDWFPGDALSGLYRVSRSGQIEPLYLENELNRNSADFVSFVDMAATTNGVFLITNRRGTGRLDPGSTSLLWIRFDGSQPEILLNIPESNRFYSYLGGIASDGIFAYLSESLALEDGSRQNSFIRVSLLGNRDILSGNFISQSRLRRYGSNQFLAGGTGQIDILNQLGEYIEDFINPHVWLNGLIRPTGDFRENPEAPETVTLVASDSGGLLFPNGAFVEQTPGRDARILLKFPESLRPQDVTIPEVESFPLRSKLCSKRTRFHL